MCFPFNAPLLMIRSINHLFKILDLPSGEGALTVNIVNIAKVNWPEDETVSE